MPFGLTFQQMMDIGNEVPGLVDDMKKLVPTLRPILEQVAATIERADKSEVVNDVEALLGHVKDEIPAIAAIVKLAGEALAPERAGKTIADIQKIVGQVKPLLPQLPPLIRKVSHMLEILATSETPHQAQQKVASADWNRIATDRASNPYASGM